MAKIDNWVENQFAQIRLEDGTKVFVSVSSTDVKIIILNVFGFPKETIHTFEGGVFERANLVSSNNPMQYFASQILATIDDKEKLKMWAEDQENFLANFNI